MFVPGGPSHVQVCVCLYLVGQAMCRSGYVPGGLSLVQAWICTWWAEPCAGLGMDLVGRALCRSGYGPGGPSLVQVWVCTWWAEPCAGLCLYLDVMLFDISFDIVDDKFQ